jgi:hypothetical protein
MTESDQEEPTADVLEQNQTAVPPADDPAGPADPAEPELPSGVPLEADEADTAEQAREVPLDEDDYR